MISFKGIDHTHSRMEAGQFVEAGGGLFNKLRENPYLLNRVCSEGTGLSSSNVERVVCGVCYSNINASPFLSISGAGEISLPLRARVASPTTTRSLWTLTEVLPQWRGIRAIASIPMRRF